MLRKKKHKPKNENRICMARKSAKEKNIEYVDTIHRKSLKRAEVPICNEAEAYVESHGLRNCLES